MPRWMLMKHMEVSAIPSPSLQTLGPSEEQDATHQGLGSLRWDFSMTLQRVRRDHPSVDSGSLQDSRPRRKRPDYLRVLGGWGLAFAFDELRRESGRKLAARNDLMREGAVHAYS
mmetsp:Transcript_25730/g.41332  ORF Transcript_25730/g.41332 Transcript_25730/m.41332 type:complete len:115 (-) Transcript_25730:188-532(-)